MATKKTAMFTLTERITMNAAVTPVSATIDLGSYVDVGDRQAIQIHSVDYVFQGTTPDESLRNTFNADSEVQVQLLDLNRGGLVFANDRALVSSGRYIYDSAGATSSDADLYPDNYGKGADDGRFVVNDQLYIEGIVSVLNAGQAVNVTVRVNASIVTLSQKDFMAIAIQSTAADN